MPARGDVVKRLLIGRALSSDRQNAQLLPKRLALPVFCSDPISSVAYATEQILLVAGLGGAAYLWLAKPISLAVVVLLAVVILSYRQTCYAYPNGGGAFVVSKDNLGEKAALTAAAALLVDYVMTVAVSIVAGVLAITSRFPGLQHDAVALSVGFVLLLAVVNLRGLKESGNAFAVPTYAFIVLTFLLFGSALYRVTAGGGLPLASGAAERLVAREHTGGVLTVLLALRAFASGCTALTGVEAISNGVPAFREPKSRNAANTLAIMGGLSVSMFAGVTVLALQMEARAYPDGFPSVISQLGAGIWGSRSVLFLLFQLATSGILILAANTAFNGFPALSSILAQNRYLPRQLHNRGDRLVFNNGVLLLAGFAIALIVGFNANIEKLIQLYIVGVFTSFTLSQGGMVRHWNKLIAAGANPAENGRYRRSRAINATGAVVTAVVLIIVVRYKFAGGAWIAMIAMGVLFLLMKGIHRHYSRVSQELVFDESRVVTLPSRNHAVVLVSQIHLPTMRALAYAKATRPSNLTALTVSVDPEDTRRLQEEWDRRRLDMPLTVVNSPYREITRPVLDYIRGIRLSSPRDVVTVFIPEYVVGRWWEQLLHNQSALRLKSRLLFLPGVMVTSVPYQLRSSRGKGADGADGAATATPGPPSFTDVAGPAPDPGSH
ncbi:MAG: APC family permease [Frankiaceae bacterium]